MDDWSRIKEGPIKINCRKCGNKYIIITLKSNCPYPWKDPGDSYYLIPKDIGLDVNYVKTYPDCNEYSIAKNNFSDAMIVKYKLDDLKCAYLEIENAKSVKQLKGIAKSIASFRVKCLKSARINVLKAEIEESIKRYNLYNGNYEQLLKQREINESLYKKYCDSVRKFGILIDFQRTGED